MTRLVATACAQLSTFQLDVSLDIPQGLTMLIGPNGSGKTTLLKTLIGLVATTSAKIELGKHVLQDSAQSHFIGPEYRSIGYVPQGSPLFPHLSVLDLSLIHI